jgi:hypothetical protein
MTTERISQPQQIQYSRGAGRVGSLADLRFRALVGADAWSRLPAAVRTRFSTRLAGGEATIYVGTIVECRFTRFGRVLANLARLIGGPLPLHSDIGVPAVVTVTEDAAGGGQFWTRLYGRRRGVPQVIHSSKRFAGCTGLEEYLGCGCGIALAVRADEHALHFTSDHYFLAIGSVRLRVPHLLAPGALTISHVDRGDGWFAFILTLRHRLLGEIIRQTGLFHQPGDAAFEETRDD